MSKNIFTASNKKSDTHSVNKYDVNKAGISINIIRNFRHSLMSFMFPYFMSTLKTCFKLDLSINSLSTYRSL